MEEIAMTVAPTLQKYLDQRVTYDLIPHAPTPSSTRTAEACHVPGEALAKAVVLRRDGGYMMAVLPASHHLHLSALKSQLGHQVDLASEKEIAELFVDCDIGAIPPVGECYGLDVIVDDSIDARRDIYLEGGDHATLIRMKGDQFAELTAKAWHGHFSTHD
jgi:Ala-tRNA(Pro) deacylase